MAYQVGDFVPSGPFLWKGRVNGNLCDCTVSWDSRFTPATGTNPAAQPRIVEVGRYVMVTAEIDADGNALPVSPGILVLTPTVTCGENVTELSPIQLRLSVNGTVTGCQPVGGEKYPATVDLSLSVGEWTNSVYSQVYSVELLDAEGNVIDALNAVGGDGVIVPSSMDGIAVYMHSQGGASLILESSISDAESVRIDLDQLYGSGTEVRFVFNAFGKTTGYQYVPGGRHSITAPLWIEQ